MKIKITEFAARHFEKKFGCTKVLDYTLDKFEEKIDSCLNWIEDFDKLNQKSLFGTEFGYVKIINGYAPFCKLIAIKNFTDARTGSLPITLENYQYIRSGYSSRRETELPVFSRWLDLPISAPKAEYLILVLYSKEQLEKEAKQDSSTEIFGFDADWGVVAILGQTHPEEEPMKPETMLRNALGIEEGGSGVALDRVKYLESVRFWEKNCTVK
jgi:hypothetical protein